MIVFEYEQALLLFAVGYECRHKKIATLHGIFSAEDAINRSIPRLNELNDGLNMLLSAKLIETIEGGYQLSSSGLRLYEKPNREGSNVLQNIRDLLEDLNAEYTHLEIIKHLTITSAEYRKSYNEYRKSFNEYTKNT